MNEKKIIFDNGPIVDKVGLKGTDIILKELDSGKVLFRGTNKVIVSGSEYNALKDFDFSELSDFTEDENRNFSPAIKSYDVGMKENNGNTTSVHELDIPQNMKCLGSSNVSSPLNVFGNTDEGTTYSSLTEGKKILYEYFTRRVCLFCVGIDGCGIENSRVFKVTNTKWIAPYGYANYDPGTGIIDTTVGNCLIPFKSRVVSASTNYGTDLTKDERDLYFGRCTNAAHDLIEYYFKGFEDAPIIHRRFADGSGNIESSSDIWASTRFAEAEIVVELHMAISPTDCREYFNLMTGINSARINTISLCTAVPFLGNDAVGPDISLTRKYYRDIRPFTKFNFPNESLIDTSKGIDISYYLYY